MIFGTSGLAVAIKGEKGGLMNKMILAVACMVVSTYATARDKPEVIYAGDGRYVCKGDRNSPTCAQVEANNRQREQQRQWEYERNRYETERLRRESEGRMNPK